MRELPKITDAERKARDERILAGIETGIFHEAVTDTERPISLTYRLSSLIPRNPYEVELIMKTPASSLLT